MIILLTQEDVVRALDSPLHPAIHSLLRLRVDQAVETRFCVIEPTDRLPRIETVLGFSVMVKGMPAFDWAIDHGQVIEVAFNVSDDMTDVLIVPDDGSKPALIAALRMNTIAPPPSFDTDKA